MPKIGVEESLTNVVEALKNRGYDVVSMKQESDAKGCDCCVVTGLDSNVMGIHDRSVDCPVIEASGLTADEVCRQVESKIGQIQH
ncbi:YkuS family protein [Sporolactobacillus sp. THM7-4]|nr:YkuS family protein [Sporolactobacillus sp. THM7-4]